MKKIYWICLIVLFIGLVVTAFFIFKSNKATVTIKEQKFSVEVAVTQKQREKGLSNRDSLEARSGMLFVFPINDIQPFWMKDTSIPLDIIWINDGKIVEMTTLDPESEENIPNYIPKQKANYALELNAGTITENNFTLGDEVIIKY